MMSGVFLIFIWAGAAICVSQDRYFMTIMDF